MSARPPGRDASRLRRLVVGVAATALTTGLLTPLTVFQAAAGTPGAGAGDASGAEDAVQPVAGPGSGEWSVTLVTGDTIRLSQGADGRSAVTADPAPRPDGHVPVFHSESGPDGTFVIPDDASAAVEAGILDRRLFDVGHLAREGFADAAAKQLPVIMSYRDAPRASPTATAKALPATSTERPLTSINGAAVKVDKTNADDFWTELRGELPTAGKAAGTPRTLAGGVRKVWLDDKVNTALDESVPLIGAPGAWEAGFDGTGSRVAVLDTGVDAGHPDLAGRIAVSKSFVAGEDIADGQGHGTHVAATIAGSGAASGGARKGVAPGAELAVGKVLNNTGSGSVSGIIAGMEWATGEAGADVVSMSLGGAPTDGTDPLSQAVDSLSTSTDTLFVVAAGNDGPSAGTVSAPGAATSALTVAATDKSDAMAGFSSRGPRGGDQGLKPDIAAPGVSIVAARASGTSLGSPVDEHYTNLNGTSMATPHVAGAAAILAQKHPDWSWSRLKAALTSTAMDAGHTAYEQGAGRVDVARATAQETTATTANVDYGVVPFDRNDPVERTVTYANDGAADVTLDLTASLEGPGGAQDGALTTGAPRVTVPAGGTADIAVTVRTQGLARGSYHGAVVATDDAGTRVTVPVGLQREPKKVPLTVRILNRDGEPASPHQSTVAVSAVDVPGALSVPAVDQTYLGDGTYRFRVQPGTYSVQSSAVQDSADGGPGINTKMFEPEVTVPDEGVTIVTDARDAVPVEFDVPRPVDRHWAVGTLTTVRTASDGTPLTSGTMGMFRRVYVTPTEKVTKGTFLFSTRITLANPQLDLSVVSPRRTELEPFQFGYTDGGISVPWNEQPPAFPEGTRQHELVDVDLGRPQDIAGLDLEGKIALKRMTGDPEEIEDAGPYWGCTLQSHRIQELKDAGAVGVLVYPGDVRAGCSVPTFESTQTKTPLPVAQILPAEGHRVKAMTDSLEPVTLEIDSNPHVDYTYELVQFEEQKIPDDLSYSYDKRRLSTVRSGYHSDQGTRLGNGSWISYKPMQNIGFGTAFPFAFPSARTDYFGGFYPDVISKGSFSSGAPGGRRTMQTVMDRPDRGSLEWVTTPLTPGAAAAPERPGMSKMNMCSFCRQGDLFVPAYVQANGDGRMTTPGAVFNAGVRMFRNGTELERVPTSYGMLPAFRLSQEEATYRLEQRGAGNDSTWTFRSRAGKEDTVLDGYSCLANVTSGPCSPQPLIFVGYDMADDLALDNTVPAGRKHTFEVNVNHHASTEKRPAIAGLELSYSTDGGETWQTARVRNQAEGVYTTTLRYPALADTSGSVSLKAQAWDTAGNRVEQTTDAVKLR